MARVVIDRPYAINRPYRGETGLVLWLIDGLIMVSFDRMPVVCVCFHVAEVRLVK